MRPTVANQTLNYMSQHLPPDSVKCWKCYLLQKQGPLYKPINKRIAAELKGTTITLDVKECDTQEKALQPLLKASDIHG